MSSLKFIKLRISEKLRDPMYRAEFFANLAQDEIAEQILALRKKRKLRQVDVADSTGMKQSAISRLEQADYSKWNFATLLRLANALDARVRVTFQPSEDVIAHYEEVEAATALPSGATDICTAREMNAERAPASIGARRQRAASSSSLGLGAWSNSISSRHAGTHAQPPTSRGITVGSTPA